MFQSALYEGLPFVGRSRLRTVLARYDPGSPAPEADSLPSSPGEAAGHLLQQAAAASAGGPDGRGARILSVRDFLERYFQVQEDSYHTLLIFVGNASDHLDYWLDWTTPIRNRPLWLHRLGRRVKAAHLALLGRSAEVRAPARAAHRFTTLHADLCRLVAFIQIASFELLSSAEEAEENFDFLQDALHSLEWQARACHDVADALEEAAAAVSHGLGGGGGGGLGPWSRTSSRGSSSAALAPASAAAAAGAAATALFGALASPPSVRFGSDVGGGAASAEASEASEPPSRKESGLANGGGGGGGGGGVFGGSAPVEEGGGLLLLPEEDEATLVQGYVRSGYEGLGRSLAAVERLAAVLRRHMRRSGRPLHTQRYGPLYALGGVGFLVWSGVTLRDRSARSAFFQYSKEVWGQFFHEWVYDPLNQFAGQLFRRLTAQPVQVQLHELRAEEEALARMLRHFEGIVRMDPLLVEKPKKDGAIVFASGDDLAERYFERSMSNPIYNVMHGHLLESCMVQTQRMKVLLYTSLYSMDAVILQLKWDFLMAGVMPLLSLCGLGYWVVSSFRRRRQKGWNQRMVRALAEVDRFFNHHSASMTPRRQGSGPLHLGLLGHADTREFVCGNNLSTPPCRSSSQAFARQRSGMTDRRCSPLGGDQAHELERVGAALGHLDALCRLASRVGLQATDWRCFRRDILDLTSPELSSQQKLHVVSAMRSTYHVFQAAA